MTRRKWEQRTPRTRHECPSCGRTISAVGKPFSNPSGQMRVRLCHHNAPGTDLRCIYGGLTVQAREEES